MATSLSTSFSEKEYLRLEREAVEKSEYIAGTIYAMSGGRADHSLLAMSLYVLLSNQKKPGCRVFNSDMRIHIPAVRAFNYPDCSFFCGDLEFYGDQRDVLLNPVLLAEVLSPSSERYARGQKFEMYKKVPSCKEFLLIHQHRRHVEHYSREPDESWLLHDCVGNDGSVTIPSLGFHFTLPALYADTIDCEQRKTA